MTAASVRASARHRAKRKRQFERMEAALREIAESNIPRPLGKRWRADGRPSKLDQCIHSRAVGADCASCIEEFARTALEDDDE